MVREVAVLEPRVAAAPPTVTEVAPDKLAPVITVTVPPAIGPALTESEENVGSTTYENRVGDADDTHPPSATRCIGRLEPVPAGVVTVTEVAVTVSIVAVNDPIFTPRVPVRLVPEITKLVPPAVVPEDTESEVIVGLPEGQSAMLDTSFTATLVNAVPPVAKSAGGTYGISGTAAATVALLPGFATQTRLPFVNEFAVSEFMVPGKLTFLRFPPKTPSPSVVMPSGTTTAVNDVTGENAPFGSWVKLVGVSKVTEVIPENWKVNSPLNVVTLFGMTTLIAPVDLKAY